jgi:hypothetical protein
MNSNLQNKSEIATLNDKLAVSQLQIQELQEIVLERDEII